MKKPIYFFFYVVALMQILSCASKAQVSTDSSQGKIQQQTNTSQPKNIIFMIGDGMGLTQVSAGYYANDMHLNIEKMPIIGLSKTTPSGNKITDSAAGATAFSIGEKTYNGAIGVDKNKQPKETILEYLGDQGFATGLIVTSAITHATPASFYAHQPSRKMGYEIAADMVNSPLDVFVGGGKKHFYDRTDDSQGEPDDRNILDELQDKGFEFVDELEDISQSKGKVGYFYAEGDPKSMLNGRGDILPKSVDVVVEKLQNLNPDGFFLMIEGSQIDWGGHANNSEYIITEMIDFDQTIGEVLDFAKKDGNTLVVITADHETGGYALIGKDKNYEEIEGAFNTGGHTATMVPVYAFGPGSENFQGIYENNSIHEKFLKSLGR